jgi:hypothetical protein
MHGLGAVPPHGDFVRLPLYTLIMGLLGALLGVFAVGYLLGLWTAVSVLRQQQVDYEDGFAGQLSQPSRLPGSGSLVDAGAAPVTAMARAAGRSEATKRAPPGSPPGAGRP